jgi:hypothetical protein
MSNDDQLQFEFVTRNEGEDPAFVTVKLSRPSRSIRAAGVSIHHHAESFEIELPPWDDLVEHSPVTFEIPPRPEPPILRRRSNKGVRLAEIILPRRVYSEDFWDLVEEHNKRKAAGRVWLVHLWFAFQFAWILFGCIKNPPRPREALDGNR